jgi:N-acetyl-gamma-glutamyl-phosphate reductase
VITAGIVGASGYSGVELLRLLLDREDVEVAIVTAHASVGKRVDALYPALAGATDLVFEEYSAVKFHGMDVVFIALPSGEAMSIVPELLPHVHCVIDLGGDFRLKSPELYRSYYGRTHAAPQMLSESVYGLPEINKHRIATARLIANPGCYPTSAILALLPALTDNIIDPSSIVINSLSGVSGAGRSSSVELSFSEVNENVRAYKIGAHQHIPEIETVLSDACRTSVQVSFTPHLIPITRGIYTTIQASLTPTVSTDAEFVETFRAYYADQPFVRVKRSIPQIKDIGYTNYCDVAVFPDRRTNRLTIVSVIDNLVKGAAGQAVQNMNIAFGLPEHTGFHTMADAAIVQP